MRTVDVSDEVPGMLRPIEKHIVTMFLPSLPSNGTFITHLKKKYVIQEVHIDLDRMVEAADGQGYAIAYVDML